VAPARAEQGEGGVLSIPGFVDLQVNGFGGVDFSDPNLGESELKEAWRALLRLGTAAFLATMITSPVDVYRRNLPLLVNALESDEFRGRVLGIHLEGPFISSEPGAVGAHDPAYVQAPDLNLLLELLDLGAGCLRLLTVAAELPGIETLIAAAAARGVAVSLGHSLFGHGDLVRLRPAGAVALTHLGNGLPNQLPRHPNPLWDGLGNDDYTAMVIADGHHLPASVLRVAARSKGRDRLIVVSDASPVAGLPAGEYQVLGNRAILEQSGRLHNPDKQCLVGSSATMLDCMNVFASVTEFDLEDLLAVGFYNSLKLIGLAPAAVRGGEGAGLAFENRRFVFAAEGDFERSG
jgi:N-acetylglucosamine-6-phosphate deacetylase